MDYIFRYEDALHTNADGYAVFYPNDGYMTDISFSTREDAEHHRNILRDTFPDAYVVRVRIERMD